MDGHTHTNPQGYDPGCGACNSGPAVAVLTQGGPAFAGIIRPDRKTDLATAQETVGGVWRQVADLQRVVERALEYETRPDSEQADNLKAALEELKRAADAVAGAEYNLGNC